MRLVIAVMLSSALFLFIAGCVLLFAGSRPVTVHTPRRDPDDGDTPSSGRG